MFKQYNNPKLGSVEQNAWSKVKNPVEQNRNGLPSLSEQEDGVNCINLWIHGETDLGKMLDKAFYMPFIHSKLGMFNTIDGIWNYLLSKTHDDRLRQLSSYKLVKLARELQPGFCVNFRAGVLDSTYQKILAYPNLKQMLIDNKLPFDCWFVDKQTGVRQRPVKYIFWYLPGLNEIKNALMENREPNFTDWMRDKSVGIYDDVLEQVTVKPKKPSVDFKDASQVESDAVTAELKEIMSTETEQAQ